jgi:hypothetical protein
MCTTEQTFAANDSITLMTTDLTMSAAAKVESDQRWAQWIAASARRNREREKRAELFAIAITCVQGPVAGQGAGVRVANFG